MPRPRALRSSPSSASLASRPAILSILALTGALAASGLVGCKSKHHGDKGDKAEKAAKADKDNKGDAAPAPEAKADPSAAPASDDGYTPLHPGHVNQRDPKGGFYAPKPAPPAEPAVAIKPVVFDVEPPEVNLATLKAEDGHCGELELGGGAKVYLDCMTDDYGTVPGAAKSLVSADDLVAGLKSPRKLPATVDHRKDGTEGPMLDQGHSATCTSFSLVTAANHAAAHLLGHPADLSPMHSWARYHSPKMSLADNDNVGKGLTDMSNLVFDAKLANAWQHGTRVEPGLLHHADHEALIDITNITRLDSGNMHEIKSALAAGQDVWFSMKAAHGLQHTKKNADGESMVSHFDWHKAPSSQRSGHAIVLAGYEDTPKGTFYLIHNSWGTKWGTDGYGWIWEKTLKANIGDAYVLQVRATELAHAKHPPHEHKFVTCSAGLVPDAVTTQCVPACQDSGPRVNGVCPTAGQCPDGEVNLDGKCELSAPSLDKTLSNGVKMTCGLSGCTYLVPNGTASCTLSQGCNVSCAAPRFMLGSGTRGLTCSG